MGSNYLIGTYILIVLVILYLMGDTENYVHPVVKCYGGVCSKYESYFGENDVVAYFNYHNSVGDVGSESTGDKFYYLTEQEFTCPAIDSEYISLSNSSTDQMKTTFIKSNIF